MAAETIATFDRARQDGDVRAALSFEKELLPIARDKFQFISHIEFIDLGRLIEDRNRCAHPSLVSDTEVFEATPELARLHIVNATRYVLAQPAAQGKQALERLVSELDSNFFPSKSNDTLVFLKAGALAKPRESLLRSYLSILIKRILKDEWDSSETHSRASNSLFALSEMHPEQWKRLMRELLAALIPNLNDDNQLVRTVKFIGHGEGVQLWDFVGEADRLRLRTFVENLPTDSFDSVEYLLAKKELPFYESSLKRVKRASADDVFGGFWFDTPELVIDRMLKIYENSDSFAQANDLAKKLRFGLYDSENPIAHLTYLAKIAKKNDQVKYSNQFPIIIKEFVQKKLHDKDHAKQLLKEFDLDEIAEQI
ncbi:hypothetical protein [Burkholderia sp. BCC0044]|uniref:hypothetical protein n=1 Tax=Burkholderia sp. BCC0044 TaxID=2676295 RepID=UPI0015887873|nr:hypothetical protein [Burkholderia sp. BCC0044]